MRKELVVFLVTLVVLAGLWFLSSSADVEGTSRGRTQRGGEAQPPVAAKSVPGRFIPGTEMTWAATASNIFETPTETRELPPLDLAPPPFPRLVHPGPPLPVPLGPKARASLRRMIAVAAAASDPANGPGGGAIAASTPPSGTGTATNPTSPTGTQDPLVPIGENLTTIQRINASLEAELKRTQEAALAKETEEERRRRLDKLTFMNQSVTYGEMAATEKNENRYKTKRDLDLLRTDPSLTEPERNDRLKKFKMIGFREDRKGKLAKTQTIPAEQVADVTFADTPENRYRTRLLEAPPKDLAQQMDLAKIVFDARLFPLAAEHLREMRKNGLSSPEMLAMLADAQHEVYDYNQELETLRQGVKEYPDSAPLLGRLGRLQVKLGMPEDARESFARALAKNPSDALANAGMGDALLRAGDPARAIPHLKEALNLAGSDALKVDAVRLLLTEAYLRQGEFKNAHETVDLILQRMNVAAPERARIFERAFALSAIAALGQGHVAEARTSVEEGVKRYPLSGPLSFLLGIVMVHQGEVEPGRARLRSAIDLDPLLTGHAQAALAIVEEATGHDNAAVASAEAGAITASPAAAELRLPLGRALHHVGDLARARQELLLALDHEPGSPDVLAALGDVAYSDGVPQEAIRFYDRAASLEPGFPQLLARRIVTQVRRRKLAEAEDLAARVTTAELKDPFMQAALAYFQYVKGNQAEALNSLQRLADSDAGILATYAKDAHAKITAHQNKMMWTDTFSRTGGQLGREWKREIGTGVNIALQGQAVGFEGQQRGLSDKPTMIWQERPGDKVYGFAVDLDLPPQPGVYAGIGLMAFNQGKAPEKWPGFPDREGGLVPANGIQVALSPDGKLVYRLLVKTKMGDWQPVPQTTYTGGPVTLELRLSDPREGIVELLVNRESVLKQQINDFKRFRRTLELQIFCQAQIDRKVHFSADNVVIVTLKDPR